MFDRGKLADLADLAMGETIIAEDCDGKGFPIYSASTDEGPWNHSSRITRKLSKGTIVVGARGSIGFPRMPTAEKFGATQTTITVNSRDSLVHPRFLFHALRSLDFKALTSQQAIPMLTLGDFGAVSLPRPPFDEQTEIVEVLDTLDTTIRQTEAIIAKLKLVKQGLLHDLLTRGIDANGELRPPQSEAPHLYKPSPLGWIPITWNLYPLSELANVNRGKFTHRPRNDPAFFGGPHPFIQTGDVAIAEGGYVSTYSQTLSERGISVSQEFPANTIAITIAANIADTAILAVPMYFPDSVVGAVVHPMFNVRFVELSIRRAKPTLDARAPQSAQKNINLQDLRPLLIAVPPRVEQDQIAERYEATQSRLELEGACAAKLRQQKSALMDDLLTGRVRVTPLLTQPVTT